MLRVEEKPNDVGIEAAPVTHLDKIVNEKEIISAPLKSSFDNLSTWQAIKTFRYSSLICFLAAFCVVTDGYQNQLTGSIIANAGFIQNLTKGGPKLDSVWVSTFGGLTSTGFVIGQFSIFYFHERFGRKAAMYTYTAVLLLAVIVESVTTEWWHWTIAKLLSGMGIGAVQATVPVYINEHAPSQIRGFLVVSYSLWFNIGNLIASSVLKARQVVEPTDWKTPVYTQFGMLGLTMIIIPFLPESPWWLVSRGKIEQAKNVLLRKYSSIEGFNITEELNIMQATIAQQEEWNRQADAEGFMGIFKGLNGKRFIIGCWPKILQQLIGLSVFASYATFFFQTAGNKDPFLVTVILGVVGIVAVGVDALLIDKIGRRWMTLVGFGGAAFGVTLMAILGCFDYTNTQLASVLVFAGVIANFCNTFQASTSYAYLTEMPEQRLRARATGWGLGVANMLAIMFNFTVPLMLGVWQVKAAFLFVGLGIPGTVVAFFIMPESSHRSSAEIHELFVERVPLRKWKGYKTEVERDLDLRMGQTV